MPSAGIPTSTPGRCVTGLAKLPAERLWAISSNRKTVSRMSRGGCCGMTNADWLISPPAAQILPGLLRERVRMAKIKETERARIPSAPAFFFVSRVTPDANACEKHFPPVISGESGRRPPPRRFAPRGRTSPYSPEMTGGSYISSPQHGLGCVDWTANVTIFFMTGALVQNMPCIYQSTICKIQRHHFGLPWSAILKVVSLVSRLVDREALLHAHQYKS